MIDRFDGSVLSYANVNRPAFGLGAMKMGNTPSPCPYNVPLRSTTWLAPASPVGRSRCEWRPISESAPSKSSNCAALYRSLRRINSNLPLGTLA